MPSASFVASWERKDATYLRLEPGLTAPLAVALVWHTHGPAAILEHPGLAPLQVRPKPRKGERPMLALPAHDPLEDLREL